PPTHRPTRAILPPSPSLIRFIYLITLPRAPRSPLFPYTTLFRSDPQRAAALRPLVCIGALLLGLAAACTPARPRPRGADVPRPDPARAAVQTPADTLTLVLLGTTDVHGWIPPFVYYALSEAPHGLGLLAPLVDSVRAAHPGRVYLFDSGDLLQGTPLALVYARVE